MTPIEMTTLQPLPAPIWFLLFFKVLGFILHAFLMNLWLAALPLALIMHGKKRSENAQFWGARILNQMPIFITFGVNFGIVPLLFIQLLYPQPFYTATILMAWHWISIIVLLIPAYYGIYLYAYALKRFPAHVSNFRRAAGWISCLFFLCIGFFFVNALTLTAEPELWKNLWLSKTVAGASSGLGSAVREAAIWPRWGMMFALAFGTTAVWTLVDRNIFQKNAQESYFRWSSTLARVCASVGFLLFAVCGFSYLQLLPESVMNSGVDGIAANLGNSRIAGISVLFYGWFLGPALVLLSVWAAARRTGFLSAFGLFLLQVVSLTLFACERQWIQIQQLHAFQPLEGFRVRSDFGPMMLFLGLFVVGAVVIVWMIAASVKCCTETSEEKD